MAEGRGTRERDKSEGDARDMCRDQSAFRKIYLESVHVSRISRNDWVIDDYGTSDLNAPRRLRMSEAVFGLANSIALPSCAPLNGPTYDIRPNHMHNPSCTADTNMNTKTPHIRFHTPGCFQPSTCTPTPTKNIGQRIKATSMLLGHLSMHTRTVHENITGEVPMPTVFVQIMIYTLTKNLYLVLYLIRPQKASLIVWDRQ